MASSRDGTASPIGTWSMTSCEQLSVMGAVLNGRVTYELIAGFWPTADTDPSSTNPMIEFARIWRNMPNIVFSRTLERAD